MVYYTPDFEYIDQNGDLVAVEVKGVADTAFRLRQKMFIRIGYSEHRVSKCVLVFKNEVIEYDLCSVREEKQYVNKKTNPVDNIV